VSGRGRWQRDIVRHLELWPQPGVDRIVLAVEDELRSALQVDQDEPVVGRRIGDPRLHGTRNADLVPVRHSGERYAGYGSALPVRDEIVGSPKAPRLSGCRLPPGDRALAPFPFQGIRAHQRCAGAALPTIGKEPQCRIRHDSRARDAGEIESDERALVIVLDAQRPVGAIVGLRIVLVDVSVLTGREQLGADGRGGCGCRRGGC